MISISDDKPSDHCLRTNAHALARYAGLCVEEGLVPIVEPEILMDGTHTIERSHVVTERTLHFVFDALYDQLVPLEQILLKPNMVLSGYECPKQASVREVAERTHRMLQARRARRRARHRVPLRRPERRSGDAHLNEMNRIGGFPWEMSFSYGRALQAPALAAWGGKKENVAAAQQAYYHRAKCNSAARYGKYSDAMEKAA